MKVYKAFTIILAALAVAACTSHKKTSTSAATASTKTTSSTNSATVSSGPILLSKSADGVYDPGNSELAAIQEQNKLVTLQTLKDGYELYTKTSCVQCHNSKSIYERPTERWKDIIDNMAIKAKISEAQKDAVYNYVLSIKATQIK